MPYDIPKLLDNLKRRRMSGYYVQNREELKVLLKELVPEGSTVGIGGSQTLRQAGVVELFEQGDYTFYNRYRDRLTPGDIRRLYIQSFDADAYLTSANAVTMDGKLFNIDGNGNRVAAMLYGPRRVIVVAGINKIVADVDAAIERARQHAAPQNARRLDRGTPCVQLGRCVDCYHKNRICNDFVLIAGQSDPDRVKVILVNETLGF